MISHFKKWKISTLVFLLLILSLPANAEFSAGKLAYERGDFMTAHREWESAAHENNYAAQAALGSLYIHGEGVKIDYKIALMWTKSAAENADVTGQFNLGSMYASGLGVKKNYTLAAHWFRLAGDQYDAISRYNLALLYSKGLGIERNDEEAVYLLNTCAIIAGSPEIGLSHLASKAEHLALNITMTMDKRSVEKAFSRSKEFEREYIGYYLKGRSKSKNDLN